MQKQDQKGQRAFQVEILTNVMFSYEVDCLFIHYVETYYQSNHISDRMNILSIENKRNSCCYFFVIMKCDL